LGEDESEREIMLERESRKWKIGKSKARKRRRMWMQSIVCVDKLAHPDKHFCPQYIPNDGWEMEREREREKEREREAERATCRRAQTKTNDAQWYTTHNSPVPSERRLDFSKFVGALIRLARVCGLWSGCSELSPSLSISLIFSLISSK